jgi:hypothetical protein
LSVCLFVTPVGGTGELSAGHARSSDCLTVFDLSSGREGGIKTNNQTTNQPTNQEEENSGSTRK